MNITLLPYLREKRTWTERARSIYTTRRLLQFFKQEPLQKIFMEEDPFNRCHWEAIFRFIYRSFPKEYSEKYCEFSRKVIKRPWYYREGSFDSRWDRLFKVYRALEAYNFVRLYYKNGEV